MIILGFFKSFLGIFQTANFEGMEVPVQVLGFMEPVVFDIYSIVLSKRWPSPLGSHVNMDVTSIGSKPPEMAHSPLWGDNMI